jgi:hypothetical protein
MDDQFPVVVEFVAPTTLHRETQLAQGLPIVGNGPPGTFVHFEDGLRVSLPTDQIVFAESTGGAVRVGFGGMRFAGRHHDGRLLFHRVRELLPDEQLSPARSHTMLLEPEWVACVIVGGERVFPGGTEPPHAG